MTTTLTKAFDAIPTSLPGAFEFLNFDADPALKALFADADAAAVWRNTFAGVADEFEAAHIARVGEMRAAFAEAGRAGRASVAMLLASPIARAAI